MEHVDNSYQSGKDLDHFKAPFPLSTVGATENPPRVASHLPQEACRVSTERKRLSSAEGRDTLLTVH